MGWMTRPNGDLWHGGSNRLWYAHAVFNKRGGAAVAATNEGRPQVTETLDRTLLRAFAAIA